MILSLVLIPLIAGVISFVTPFVTLRRAILVIAAFLHLFTTLFIKFSHLTFAPDAWLKLDDLGFIFLFITSLLFLAASLYSIPYLRHEKKLEAEKLFLFKNIPEATFIGCMLLFLASMSLVTISQHLSILWIAMEATTLFTATLIFFHRNQHSLEATWKYLIICSVGIALALMANFFLAVSTTPSNVPLALYNLTQPDLLFDPTWLKLAFLFFFVGYGTKMGLVPFHSWLPDAHSEAPTVISALLSGSLLNCAFLAILRVYQVLIAAHIQAFAQEIFLIFGLISLAFASILILKQSNFKRLLAYSSIENMAILIIGIGIGGEAIFGSLFHTMNHSLTKGALFLVAGNIIAVYKTKEIQGVQGATKTLPWSGALWLAGFFALIGSPPSALFLSKFIILKSAISHHMIITTIIFLISIGILSIGMAKAFLSMSQGKSSLQNVPKESFLSLIGPLLFLFIVFFSGIYLMPAIEGMIRGGAQLLGGP